jgi:peptidoglycan L-alanyl-D-glutamate endopeptidase CwlK
VKESALKLKDLVKSRLNLRIIFTQTLRPEAEQIALYAQGRESLEAVNEKRIEANLPPITNANNNIVTKAKTSRDSYHGYGLAFDIAITDLTGKYIKWDRTSDWNSDGINDWDQVGSLATECGLEWGGNWTSMPDPPHFQMSMGYTIAQLKNGAASKI